LVSYKAEGTSNPVINGRLCLIRTDTGYNGKQEIDVSNRSMDAAKHFPKKKKKKVINVHITRK
jgi:hypothetical protein